MNEGGPVSPDALSRAIRAASVPALLDVRSRGVFLRRHVAGSVSIPASMLTRSLFLLPPRDRPLVVLARDATAADDVARLLIARGWEKVAWLGGSPADLPPACLIAGGAEACLWEPAPLLRRFADHLPRSGPALDLACGSGREATFLSLRGLDALGVDLLPDALRQARALARRTSVQRGRLRFRRVDLTAEAAVKRLLRPSHYRVITCFRYLDRALFPRLADALAPGGWLVYQTFLEAQARAGRKPRRAAFLLKSGELRRAFAELEIVQYEEGPDARGDHLASLVAIRSRTRKEADS